MKRRQFLISSSSLIASIWSSKSTALTSCSPFFPNGGRQCESGIDSSLLHIEAQADSQWCWAACIAMVFGYYGRPVSQKRIVSDTWGSIVNMQAQPGQIMANLNRPWIDDTGVGFGVSGDVYSANPMTAAQDLAQNMPLIIGTMGHAMVLTSLVYQLDGYGNGSVTAAMVRDPWPRRGRRILTAAEWYQANFLTRIRVL